MPIFLGGLFCFLLGIEGSKKGLERLTFQKLQHFLERLTGKLYMAILIGLIVTAVLQSSSAVSVILISFLEAGIIKLKPALGIMLGANIGTTVTVQIVSLPVLKFYPVFILLGLIFLAVGIIINKKIFYTGLVLTSFGLIFAGLVLMSAYFNQPGPQRIITSLLLSGAENILPALLVGIVITAIVQSSSAVTGITVSLARSGLITLPLAVAIALGSNVGTCITAFLASINCGRAAKNLAWGHLLINVSGVLFVLPVFYLFITLVKMSSSDLLRQIANAHSLFNILNVLLFLPFLNTYLNLAERNHRDY